MTEEIWGVIPTKVSDPGRQMCFLSWSGTLFVRYTSTTDPALIQRDYQIYFPTGSVFEPLGSTVQANACVEALEEYAVGLDALGFAVRNFSAPCPTC